MEQAKRVYLAGAKPVPRWNCINPPVDVIGPPTGYILDNGQWVDSWIVDFQDDPIAFIASEISVRDN
jgi:hypothetical protein